MKMMICSVCGKEYRVYGKRQEYSKFCSRKCGGTKLISTFRIGTLDGLHVHVCRGRARVVLGSGLSKDVSMYLGEKVLGRPLNGNIVHHLDGDPLNNSRDNLIILQNRSEHTRLHARLRVLKAGGDPKVNRICSSCKQLKLKTDFYTHKTAYDGLHRECKQCISDRGKRRRKSNA